ncbi:MAG: hypothetical protein KIT44_05855 [Opitutaceae bacterium]|nr:hypothetical protein [Opitutaceae bacterium]
MSSPARNRWWLWAALALTAAKLWLTLGQTIYAVGPAIHDDKLFILLTEHILHGRWLGPYDQFTLAKGPLYSLFMAANFWLGLPLLFTQQLLYAAACAALVAALRPWLRNAGLQFVLYAWLLLNPMSYDASNLTRLMRQSIYAPLGMLVIAALITLFARRRESSLRLAIPAVGAGLAFGGFWLTREESVWLLPAIGLIWAGVFFSVRRELRQRWRPLVIGLGCFLFAGTLPVLAVSWQNLRHYGWFGTVEFRAAEFKNAYGALTRIAVGPDLPKVIVTRQMREAAYAVSPTFALLQPHLEGEIGMHWVERELFPAEERQIRGGWFMWALRDAHAAAGLAPDAATALRNYQKIADEINAACDSGRLASHSARSGFFPQITRDDIGPIKHTTLEYLDYFGAFRGFTAHSPDSAGDYAELKPFRDYTGTHLSHAPRSPDPLPPEQSRLQRLQVTTLESAGRLTAGLIAWVGPMLLLIGLARAAESVWRRRVTFLLGLAAALLVSVGIYLAVNILITVTAFRNVSPGAMAAAYPLYLLALFAIAGDAWNTWIRPAAGPESTRTRPPSRWLWVVAAGAALVVWAARLAEIHFFGSDVAHNDQWYIEAAQIIAPWLNGTLQLRDFFAPHFEHVPVWTRLLAWLQVLMTGRWDPLVQTTVNALIHAVFIGLVSLWACRNLRPGPAVLAMAVLILGGVLPHAWENITWGFQSQFPLALVFLFLHVQGTSTHPAGTKGWWWAQAAAFAGLFTLASMWLAPLAMVLSWLWTGPRRWREQSVPLFIAALGAGMLVFIKLQQNTGGAFSQLVGSPLDFLHAGLHLLGWPSVLPGAVAIIQLPWLIHALRLRNQPAVPPVDRMIFVLGLWNCAQALGLAAARAGDSNDFVSRYGDVLFVGVLAGALALPRLIPPSGRLRTIFLLLGALWGALVLAGLVRNSTQGHAHYFHLHAGQNAEFRRTAVQNYLQSGHRELLESATARSVLCQEPDLVAGLLDQPKFRALLPRSVDPQSPPDAAGTVARQLQARWGWLLAAGLLALGLGLILIARGGTTLQPPPPLVEADDPWRLRISALVLLSILSLAPVWLGSLAVNAERRWHRLLGGDRAIGRLTFDFVHPAEFGPERLQGAAPIRPEMLRNRFYGTAPQGPGYTGTVISSPFLLNSPWLVVPYAGYPVGDGNGLRIRLLDAEGRDTQDEIGCHGPNVDGIAYWLVDVREHQGRRARLVLYDGRAETQGWVAAAPPIPTNDAALAVELEQGLRNQKHAGMHVALLVIAGVALICTAVSWTQRRRPRPAPLG